MLLLLISSKSEKERKGDVAKKNIVEGVHAEDPFFVFIS